MTSTNFLSAASTLPADTKAPANNKASRDSTSLDMYSPSLSPPILLQLRCPSQASDENPHWHFRPLDSLHSSSAPFAVPEAPVPVAFDASASPICRHLKWANVCAVCANNEQSKVPTTHLESVHVKHPATEINAICEHFRWAESCEVCSAGQQNAGSIDGQRRKSPTPSTHSAIPLSPPLRTSCPPPPSIPSATPGGLDAQEPPRASSHSPLQSTALPHPDNHTLHDQRLHCDTECANSVLDSPCASHKSEISPHSQQGQETDNVPSHEISIPVDVLLRLIRSLGTSSPESPSPASHLPRPDSPPPMSNLSSPDSPPPTSHVSHRSQAPSLSFSREREMIARKADPPAGSIVVQQFSSSESPTCTIMVGSNPPAEPDTDHHHNHHHHHHNHHRHEHRCSRSRSREPLVIMPAEPESAHYSHSGHHTRPQIIYQRSRSPSPVHVYPARSRSPSVVCIPSEGPPAVVVGPISSGSRTPSLTPHAHISEIPTSPHSPTRSAQNSYAPEPDSPHLSPVRSPLYMPSSCIERPFSPNWPHHENFYFADGTVTFRVGVELYKLHRHFFDQHSIFFHDLFASLDLQRGFDDPIVLSEVQAKDFDRLLTIFYPTSFTKPDLTTVEEWTSVLILATQWVFNDIRALAIEHLSPMISAVDKIVLGTKYDVHDWLAPAYKELCTRWRPLDIEEGTRLGTERVIEIGQMRSELDVMAMGDENVLKRIKEAFHLEN